MRIVRASIVLAVIAGAAALVAMSLHPVQSSRDESTEESAPVPLVTNSSGKGNKANSGAAALDGYLIVQTETGPITTALAAAARAVMERPLPPPVVERPREKDTNALLNDAQIASLRDRLRLTPEQAQHWPAVEGALRIFVTRQYEANRRRPGATPPVDPDSQEVQNLRTAAAPFFASLDDRQRQQIRLLAGMIGLDAILAQL